MCVEILKKRNRKKRGKNGQKTLNLLLLSNIVLWFNFIIILHKIQFRLLLEVIEHIMYTNLIFVSLSSKLQLNTNDSQILISHFVSTICAQDGKQKYDVVWQTESQRQAAAAENN